MLVINPNYILNTSSQKALSQISSLGHIIFSYGDAVWRVSYGIEGEVVLG